MNQTYLRLYVSEGQRHHGMPAYDWLLDAAKKLGVAGGTVFRALAGYGRHHTHHDAGFFELAGDLPVMVEFFLPADKADQLIARVHAENLNLFYARIAAETGITGS